MIVGLPDPQAFPPGAAASVIGKDMPLALLAAIADQPDAELRAGLADLQAAEFMYETSLFPDIGYTFKHALTYEVTYHSLLKERRRELHARTMEAIERLYAGFPARAARRADRDVAGLRPYTFGRTSLANRSSVSRATARVSGMMSKQNSVAPASRKRRSASMMSWGRPSVGPWPSRGGPS